MFFRNSKDPKKWRQDHTPLVSGRSFSEGDWRHCYVGASRVQVPSEKVCGSLRRDVSSLVCVFDMPK